MIGSHSCRWCCPHGWNFQDHIQPLWRHNASIPESGPWEQFIYEYHGTVWSLHQVPQRWKWQSLNILVIVHRHDRDFTGTNLSNQRGSLDATPGTRTNHNPMLLRRDISAAKNPPRCSRLIHARRDFSSAWLLQLPLSEEPLSVKRSKKRWTRTHIRQRDQEVQFEAMCCEQILIDRQV